MMQRRKITMIKTKIYYVIVDQSSMLILMILQISLICLYFQKSLHSIALDEAELKSKMVHFSQERYVNSLLNHLTELAFQGNDSESDSQGAHEKSR